MNMTKDDMIYELVQNVDSWNVDLMTQWVKNTMREELEHNTTKEVKKLYDWTFSKDKVEYYKGVVK
jgi:hypothetical protein